MKKTVFSLCIVFLYSSISGFIFYKKAAEKESHYNPDSFGYEQFALTQFYEPSLKASVSEQMPPQPIGYPYILALIFKITGNSYQHIIIVQIALGLITLFLIAGAATHLFGHAVYYPSMILGVLHTGFLVYPHFILTETILVFVLAFFLERLCFFFKYHSYWALLGAAFFLGTSLAIKAVALFFIPVFSMWCVYYFWIYNINSLSLLGVFFAIAPIPLLIMSYNYHVYGSWQIAPTAHENIYYYFLGKIVHADTGRPLSEVYAELEKTFEDFPRFNQQRWIKARTIFWGYCFDKPFFVSGLWLKEIAKIFGGLYHSQLKNLFCKDSRSLDLSFLNADGSFYLHRLHNYIKKGSTHSFLIVIGWLEFIFLIARYILMMIGLREIIKSKKYDLAMFCIMYIGYFSFVAGHDGCARYRMPIEPVMIILAAYGIVIIWYKYTLMNKQIARNQEWIPA